MAHDLNTEYPANSAPSSPSFPFGAGRNVTLPGDNTGTPFDEKWFNDWNAFFQSLLVQTGTTPNGSQDTVLSSQYFDAFLNIQAPAAVKRPTNLTPAASATVTGTQPTLQGSAYQSLYGRAHTNSRFRVATDAGMTNVIYNSGLLGPVEQHTLITPIAVDATYYWDVQYTDEDEISSQASAATSFDIPLAAVQTPTISFPVNNSENVETAFTVAGSAFGVLGGAQTHTETTVEVATDSAFASIIDTTVKSSGDLENVDVTGLPTGTVLYVRMRYQGSVTGYSSNSAFVKITTLENAVSKPTITSPTDNTTGAGPSIVVTSSAFAFQGAAQTQDGVRYIVYTDEALTNVFYDSGVLTSDFQSRVISGLSEGLTSYWITKADSGDLTGFGPFSDAVKVTTLAQFADWSQWGGTADGTLVTYSGTMTSTGDTKTNRILCEIGNGRFLSVYDTSAGFKVQVIGTFGLALSTGGEVDTGLTHDASDPQPAAVKIGDDKVMIVWMVSSSTLGAVVATISGNNVTFGTPLTLTDSLSGGTQGRWFVNRIEDDKVLLTYSRSTLTVSCRVLTATGTTVSAGARYDVQGAINAELPVRCGSVDVRGTTAIIAFTASQMNFIVVDIDTTTDVVTTVATNGDDNTPATSGSDRYYAKWVDDNQFIVGEVRASLETQRHYVLLGRYDGASTVSVLSYSPLHPPVASNSSTYTGAGFASVSPNELVAFYKVKGAGVFGRHMTIFGGNVFFGDVITIDAGSNSDNQYTDIKAIDDSRLLITYDVSGPALAAKILNGEVQP